MNQSFVVEATDSDSGNNSLLSYSFQTDGPNGINSDFEISTVNRKVTMYILLYPFEGRRFQENRWIKGWC